MPPRIANVAAKIGKAQRRIRSRDPLLRHRAIAKPQQRIAARFFRRHARRHIGIHTQIDVRLQFGVDVVIDAWSDETNWRSDGRGPSGSPVLFGAQRLHGIDARGTPGWNPA